MRSFLPSTVGRPNIFRGANFRIAGLGSVESAEECSYESYFDVCVFESETVIPRAEGEGKDDERGWLTMERAMRDVGDHASHTGVRKGRGDVDMRNLYCA